MGLILELTAVKHRVVELETDEEIAEYRQAQAEGWDDDFLDPYWSDMDTVERTIQEY